MDSGTDDDIAAVVDQLTLEEKASLCLGSDFWHTRGVERLGIPAVMVSDGPHGLRKQPEGGDHVGLTGSIPATCFPTASALGSSWDVDLLRTVGDALGRESRAENVAVLLGPGINIKRSPLCGRNFEYLSEDPLVSGALGAAFVEGVQSQGVGACLKHYAVNNQETDRLRVSADVDERTMREIYLAGFERVVQRARPWTVMCSYNKVNGTYASQNHWLLTTVLREEWRFGGLVMSDWGAVHDRVAALAAGLDLEMPPNLGVSDAAIVDSVRAGDVDEAVLDAAVARVLALGRRAQTTSDNDGTFDASAHHALARTAAQDCAVLLKNDHALLPLQLEAGSRLAVIGEFARTPRYQGAGSSQVNPTRLDIPLEELRIGRPAGVDVSFAPGFRIDTHRADTQGPDADGTGQTDAELADEAVALATDADTVVVFLGLPAGDESEGFDRRDIDLPAAQVDLVTRLAAVNPRIVVVLVNGSVVRVADWANQVPSILECWLSGQAAGGAVADLLLGHANPSGRLAETIPLRLQDNPSYLNFPGESGHVRYGEGIFVGYRGYDASEQAVSYPFGHGLSYTTFDYADLTVRMSGSQEHSDLVIALTCTVTNTGTRAGREVVQLYVADPVASVARPPRELKAFHKVALDTGQTATVRFELTSRDLSYWSPTHHDWVLEGGRFQFSIGTSSRDMRLTTTLDVPAPPVTQRPSADSTLDEWLADPIGRNALYAVVGIDPDGQPAGILGDQELIPVLGNFPLRTLTAFPGLGVDHATLASLLQRVGTS